MNADPIARIYRFLEYATFGTLLWRTRTHYLHHLKDKRRILIAGEGDGRFLAELLKINSQAQIDIYDNSTKMIELAKARTKLHAHRLTFHYADLRVIQLKPNYYDAIVANFFFDCFNNTELGELIHKLRLSTTTDAVWLIAEFSIPPDGPNRWAATILIRILYLAFAITTGLETRTLPDYESQLLRTGLKLFKDDFRLSNFLTSQVWIDQIQYCSASISWARQYQEG